MPGTETTSDAVLDRALRSALASDEAVKSGVLQGLNAKALEDTLRSRVLEHWSQLEPYNEAVDRAASRYATVKDKHQGFLYRLLEWAGWAGLLIVALAIVISVGTGLAGQGWLALGVLHEHVPASGIVATAFLALMTGGATVDLALSNQRRIADESGINDLAEELRKARADREEAALDQIVMPELRRLLSMEAGVDDQHVLDVGNAEGLTEVYDPLYEISTTAAHRLVAMFEGMRGGSIGIAGSRGAGKTTLIRAAKEGRIGPEGWTPTVGVMASAPVEYDARDFVLHMFAEVCRKVLGPTLVERLSPGLAPGREQRVTIVALTIVSYGLLASAGFVAVGGFDISVGRALVTSLLAGGAVGTAWGAMRLVLRRRRHRRLFDLGAFGSSVQQRAASELAEIRFQQTFSSGWSGKLAAPAIVELNAEQRVTLAGHQLSLPEIVHKFRSLLGEIAQDGPVIIGIDELDKMESEEQARRFLNELKSLFGLPGCFFLVSVSEDALSAFERRGVPLRDVFDSSFDAVLRVPPLDQQASTELLRRRVIAMPIAFQSFCHAFAGGLPRDVIRAARALVAESNTGPSRELGHVVRAVLSTDVDAKILAAVVVARRCGHREMAADVVQWLRELRPLEAGGMADACRRAGECITAMKNREGAEAALVSEQRDLICEVLAYGLHVATLVALFDQPSAAARALTAREGAPSPLELLADARNDLSVGAHVAWQRTLDARRLLGLPAVATPAPVAA